MNDQLSNHVQPWLKGLVVTGLLLQPLSALAEVECFAVADNDRRKNSADVMMYLALPGDNVLKKGGITGTENIEAIAFGPGGNPLYAANGDELGTLNQETGEFTPIGKFGTGMGNDCADNTGKEITFDDVDALAFYKVPESEDVYELYAVHRREHGANALPDILFRIPLDVNNKPMPNGVDGSYYVPAAYGGSDFVCVTGGQQDVDDMTQCLDEGNNSCDFEDMYVTLNDGNGMNSSVAQLDVATGVVSDVQPLTWNLGNDAPVSIMAASNDQVHDIEGVTSSPNGKVYATTGNGGDMKEAGTQNYLLQLNLNNGTVAILSKIRPPDDPQQDYEAVSCRDNSEILTSCHLLAVHDESVNDSQLFIIYPEFESEPNSEGTVDMTASSTIEAYGPMHMRHDLEGLALFDKRLIATSGSDQRKGIPDGAVYEVERSGEEHPATLLFETDFSEVSALGVRNDKELWGFARGGNRKQKSEAGPILIDLDGQSAELKQAFPFQDPDIQAMAWSADGNTLYLASENKVKREGKKRLVKVTEITAYSYDEGGTPVFELDGFCRLDSEVEALEGQANGLLLAALHGKEGLGILALEPPQQGDEGEDCTTVASRKFQNVLNYDDIESIALSCPTWLDASSGNMQIAFEPEDTLPNHVLNALYQALQDFSDDVAIEEQYGDIIAEMVQNAVNTTFVAHVTDDSPFISSELMGTIENAQLTFENGMAILTYTVDGEAVSVKLAPRSIHNAQLLAALRQLDENADIDENGFVTLNLHGQDVCGVIDFTYIPAELVDGMLLAESNQEQVLFETLFTDPARFPDTTGDGNSPDYIVKYIQGSAQLIHKVACP